MSFTVPVFSYNATVLLIQPNPWMDPTHVHLWCSECVGNLRLQSCAYAPTDTLQANSAPYPIRRTGNEYRSNLWQSSAAGLLR